MPSPLRLFRNFTDAQLAQLQAEGFTAALMGQFTSTGGASKNGTKQRLSIETLLNEMNHELDVRAGRSRPQKVQQDLISHPCNTPSTITFTVGP